MVVLRRQTYLVPAPPPGPVHAAATFLPMPNGWGGGRTVARFNRDVERQLAATPGALAYSLQRTLFGGHFWTLSLWTDAAHMREFVGAGFHATAARWLRGRGLEGAKLAQWSAPVAALRWEDAYQHLGMAPPSGLVLTPPVRPPPGWSSARADTSA